VPTFAQALAAFDQLVARLPGVHPPRGTVGSSSSGSAALTWLEGYRNRLTRAQRAVLDRVASRGGTAAVTKADATLDQFVTLMHQIRNQLIAKGLRFPHTVYLGLTSTAKLGEDAYTSTQWLYGTGNACVITIRPLAVAASERRRRLVVAHELTHCAIGELTPSREADARLPAWVAEGLPDWAAYRLVDESSGPSQDHEPGSWWPTWLRRHPQRDLFRREYDAVGFWALVEHEGADLWRLLPAIVSDAGVSKEAVYGTVTRAAHGDFAGDWGPTMATKEGIGARWDLNGPGMPRLAPTGATIGNGGAWGRTFGPRGGYAAQLSLVAEVIHIRRTSGTLGFLRDSSGAEQPVPVDGHYCAKSGGCRCDDGTVLPFPAIGHGPADIGVSDETGVGSVVVQGEPLSQHCTKQPTGPPNRPACTYLAHAGVQGFVGAGGWFAYPGGACVYNNCTQKVNQGGQSKCAYGRGAFLEVHRVATAKRARDFVQSRRFPRPPFRSINIGADAAVLATKPSGGVVEMAQGRNVATLTMGAHSDTSSPVWHNEPAVIELARRVARQLR
jgi:hypothetical protein